MTLYAIGDIQGCAAELDRLLGRLDFDAHRDELWLVGDLVNRGPDSLGVLRRVRGLGARATCVLGNHDLHLLAVAAGARAASEKDTFMDVLDARDAGELLDWLRRLPLLHHDADRNCVLVHAGLPPSWSLEKAARRAARVERALRDADWRAKLATMYGNSPRAWSPDLTPAEKRRYTINALTRMRFCRPSGELDFEHSGPPGTQPAGLVPWFDVPERRARELRIVCGHWAALGLYEREDVLALDTGCVWGRALTAVPLDPPGAPVAVGCG